MQKEFKTKINEYLKNNTKRRHKYQVLMVISVAIIFLVYSVLTKPAISMAYDNISVEAMRENTSFGQVVPVRVTAEALQGTEATTFVMYTKGVGGGLTSEYHFENGSCQITAEDGSKIELHKEDIVDEESGNVVKHNYWFTLQPEEKTAFVLHYTSDVEVITKDSDSDVTEATTEKATEEEKTEATTEKAMEEEKTEATTEKATEEEKTEAITEKATEEEKTEATTEKATEEEKTEATTEKATEEEKTEATTEKAAEEEKSEDLTPKVDQKEKKAEETIEKQDEVKNEEVKVRANKVGTNATIEEEGKAPTENTDVTMVNPTTFNKIAMAEVEYIVAENDVDNKESVDTEQASTESQESTTIEDDSSMEETTQADTTSASTQVVTDQYLDIYVGASTDGTYEEIATQLEEKVEGWQGNVPAEQVTTHKVASLSWTDEENITDIILKARTEEGVLVTVSGNKNSFVQGDRSQLELNVIETSTTKEIDETVLEEDEVVLESKKLDISLLADGTEVQLEGEVHINIQNMQYSEQTQKIKAFHIQGEEEYEILSATRNEDGTIQMNTNSFSEYEFFFIGTDKLDRGEITWESPTQTDYLGTAREFNIFLFGDLENIKSVEGSLAIQGNMTFESDFLAAASTINTTSQLQLDISPTAILFGGDAITIPEGSQIITAPLSEDNDSQIWINSNSFTKDKYDIFTEYSEVGKMKNITNIKEFFEEARTSLEKQSQTLFNKMESETTAIVQTEREDKTLKFIYDGEATEIIFEVDIENLCDENIEKWTMHIPDNAIAIINVKGEGDISITPMFEKESIDSYVDLGRRVLWNFEKEIANVELKGNSAWMGSILAPNTDFDITDFTSTIDGTVVANHLKSETQGNVSCAYFPLKDLEKVDQVKKEQLTAIHITKEWEDEKKAKMVDKVDVSIYDEKGEKVSHGTLTEENGWSVTVKDLPMYDVNGDVIQYKVAEEISDSSIAGLAEYSGQEKIWIPVDAFIDGQEHILIGESEDGKQYIFNSNDISDKVEVTEEQSAHQETESINGEKQTGWLVEEDVIPASYAWKVDSIMELDGQTAWDLQPVQEETKHLTISEDGLKVDGSGTSNQLESTQLFTTNEETNETIYVDQVLETSTDKKEAIRFKVFASVRSDMNVTLVPDENKTTIINVNKEWEDGNDEHDEDAIIIQLYWRLKSQSSDEASWSSTFNISDSPTLTDANGNMIDSKVELSSGNWQYTWYASNSDKLGNAYEYKVEEIQGVDGYLGFVSQDETMLTIFTPVSVDQLDEEEVYAIISEEGYILGVDTNDGVEVDLLSKNEEEAWTMGDMDTLYQWKVIKDNTINNGLYFQNIGDALYLSISGTKVKMLEEKQYLEYDSNENNWIGIDGKYIKINKKSNTKFQITTDRESGTSFQFYKIQTFTQRLDATITNNEVQLGSNTFPHTKQIDYLGDGDEDSKEYTSITDSDAYRLYLDLASNPLPTPVDVVFVLDKSSSMKGSIGVSEDSDSRISSVANQAKELAEVIEGNSENESDDNKNRMSIISFNTDAIVESFSGRNWTYSAEDINNIIDRIEGEVETSTKASQTNTIKALQQLQELLKENTSGRKKYVFFLTDGAPTCYYEEVDDNWILHEEGNDLEAKRQTISYAQTVKSELSDQNVTIYSVGISKDTEVDNAKEVLNAITTIPGSVLYASDGNSLESIFRTLVQGLSAKGLSITDTLSNYVELNETADITVTMKERTDIRDNCADEEEIVLWKGQWNSDDEEIEQESSDEANQVTEHMKISHEDKNDVGIQIIDYIEFDPETKQIKVTFNSEYLINKDYVYTLSFNVVLSDKAKEMTQYPENMKGDINTDYKNNETSENKPGLFANEYSYDPSSGTYIQSTTGVNIGYTLITSDGNTSKMIEGYTEKPVVQISEGYGLIIEKVDMDGTTNLPSVSFDLYRVEENGDTLLEEHYGIEDLVAKINKDSLTTDSNGIIQLTKNSTLLTEKLVDGTYYLVETKAATGYEILKPCKFILKDGAIQKNGTDSMFNGTSSEYTITLTVKNSKTASLPVTGGMGTNYFIIIGLMIMTISVVGIIYIRKQQSYKEER